MPIQNAINHLITHATEPKDVRNSYANNSQAKLIEKAKTVCKEFQDIFSAEKAANKPLQLVKEARTKLEVLKGSLRDFKKTEDSVAICNELTEIKKIVKACFSTIKLPKHKKI
jgi:hypothetical protein